MIKPITPDEVVQNRLTSIPDEVFKAFNQLITENYKGIQSVVRQDSVLELIGKLTGLTRHEITERGWLDVEEFYREAGWEVTYKKPTWEDHFETYFKFTRKA